jgi:hypothetical protein
MPEKYKVKNLLESIVSFLLIVFYATLIKNHYNISDTVYNNLNP